MLAGLLVLAPAAVTAQMENCIPSCTAEDGRFLAVTDGIGLDTLTDETLDLQIRSPGGGYPLAFFDGEVSGAEGLWDANPFGLAVPRMTFTLWTDPEGDGVGNDQVQVFSEEQMVDNDWVTFQMDDVPGAMSSSGEYIYLLRAELKFLVLAPGVRSVFKVGTGADVLIEVFQQPFAFISALLGFGELGIIYPECLGVDALPLPTACLESLANTTYDGDFRFFLLAREPQDELVIWDGDLDRGDWDGGNPDDDDPNTANDFTGLPPWACEDGFAPCTDDGGANPRLLSVNFEGVARGNCLGGTRHGKSCRVLGDLACPGGGSCSVTGNPPDDFAPTGALDLNDIWVRSGPIEYEVWGPDARLLATNDNPSGNAEWERFRVALVDDGDADAVVEELPAGIYEVRVKNLDLENLNAFRFGLPASTEPNCDDGRPTGLTFIYTGDLCSDAAASNNSQGGLPGTSGDYECTPGPAEGFAGPVKLVPVKKPQRFEMVPYSALIGGELTIRTKTKNNRLFPHTELEVQKLDGTLVQAVTIHSSCSQPLIVGEQFGSLKLFTYFLKF